MAVNHILHPAADAPLGVITSGLAYTYLEHALQILGLSGRFPILKLGISYPLDPEIIERFTAQTKVFCVV